MSLQAFVATHRESGTIGVAQWVGRGQDRQGPQRVAGFGDVLPVGSSTRLVTVPPRKWEAVEYGSQHAGPMPSPANSIWMAHGACLCLGSD